MTDGSIPRQERGDVEQQLAWAALVDEFAPLLWAAARAGGSPPREAAATCQLVWLRLEVLSRRAGRWSDLRPWLVEQVAEVARTTTSRSR